MGICTSALLWFSKDMAYPPAEIEKAARYSMLWLLGHTDLIGSNGPDYTSIDATIAQIRAVNPRARIGLYVGGLMFKREIDPPAAWLTDDDLLHYHAATTPLVFYDATATFSPPADAFTYCAPNLTSDAVIDKLVTGYVGLVQDHHLDGILLDGYDADFYAALVAGHPSVAAGMFGASAGCAEGPLHTAAAWIEPLERLGDRLTFALDQVGATFMFNGIHPGFTVEERVAHAHGAMMEAVGQVYGDASELTGVLDVVGRAAAMGRRVAMLAHPWYTKPATLDVERFLLGAHLLADAPGVSFGYHPYVGFRAWDGDAGPTDDGHPHGNPYVHWSPDWDLDYGYPLAPAAPLTSVYGVPTAVWGRQYSRCVVLVNPADTTQQAILSGRYREWHPETGPIVDQATQAPHHILNVAPRTARVLFRDAA